MTDYVDRTVEQLIKRFHTNDPFYIARRLNIYVHLASMDASIGGFYRYLKRNKFIIINNKLQSSMRVFVTAHELGHAVLHPKTSTYFLKNYTSCSASEIEDDANEFATKLLINPNKNNTEMTREKLLEKYGIPSEMKRFI
ncbi:MULTISPECIES: ImmA/IrrE family metallo-endopeptidase [unclassified Sporolactobacillus]|uniref:ImmA/IrrE family metallo-endopeptidase n=1 Tax=unclassified Sporolactobacillus TaxID=2628533 RepID=UPI002368271B|nr:ImmA/IrrE family metallo-endopeptidase [Sporolactobacillus sp. CQH2019]MDD9149697.1 ImmA/IrrE family metallo-endopeptidase [Sporolactobacillus sp. CQH2019]